MHQLTPPESSFIVIVTRGHWHEMRVLGWAANTAAHSVGMIGSNRKVLTVCQELGALPSRRPFLDIGASSPEEIAVSVVADLIADRGRCEAKLPHLRCVEELISEEASSVG